MRTRPTSLTEERLELPAGLVAQVRERLAANQRVRRALPAGGRLHIDRQLPFLCVYRQPLEHDDAGTRRLVEGEASYLSTSWAPALRQSVATLVHDVVETLSAEFGAFLVVEVWAAPDGGKANDATVPSVPPTFTIHAPSAESTSGAVQALQKRLSRAKVLKQAVRVEVQRDSEAHPPTMAALLTEEQASKLKCSFLGIAVPPVYREAGSTNVFPLLLRALRHALSLALRQAYFEFARARTTQRPAHYHELGRRAVVKAVWQIDRQLAAVDDQFDYLLLLTPVNSVAAWKQFQREQFERAPEFHYRPLPVDPDELKRELFKVTLARVEDPALQRLFQQKQAELELKLTMLRDRDTPRFVFESLQLFGAIEGSLQQLATQLLHALPAGESGESNGSLSASEFANRAKAEIDFYAKSGSGFDAHVQVTGEVNGLLVSSGNLWINSDLVVAESRVDALLAHEVGTHLLSYYNGRMQPFQQLYSGLAGYEELQEGIAVLSEYLVAGLSRTRLRQLAGRVVAVDCLVRGASFVETFRTLRDEHGFAPRPAYNITMRVYRGGGLTKDAIYLRGLQNLLRYLRKAGDLSPLLVGKIAIEHVPIIQELQYRKVLEPARFVPRYLQEEACNQRLRALSSNGGSVLEMAREVASSDPAGA